VEIKPAPVKPEQNIEQKKQKKTQLKWMVLAVLCLAIFIAYLIILFME